MALIACPSRYVPKAVIGDLDSVSRSSLEYYGPLGTEIVHYLDQDTNDLEKCFKYLREKCHITPGDSVIVLGSLGGRFDQEMANINAVLKHYLAMPTSPPRLAPPDERPTSGIFGTLGVVLVSEESLVSVLMPTAPGHPHVIYRDEARELPTCGLIPLFGASEVITTGLQWNVTGPLQFGSLISTSNASLDRVPVTVHCDRPLVWTRVLR
ncbi:putative Thiamine pyrophosphokinase [Paratrimastix pyriformis]|uniref:Thiamine pyrophosphokinase n=1 Tax=Paratrimastix pyriformis TaxID=342808 RepID=A0ABQ8URD4_9EUKA|nr:putative Thiamine pyrophosphokinase [Paratrimastix pyriformis]